MDIEPTITEDLKIDDEELKRKIACLQTTLGKFIDVGEHKIHYVTVGHGDKNLLLISGAFDSLYGSFHGQLEKLDLDVFTIYALDIPGYGHFRTLDRTFPYNYHSIDAKTVFQFLKVLGISKTSVIGWCDGGTVAAILAADNPGLVEKLVMFGSRAYIDCDDVSRAEDVRHIDTWPPALKDEFVELYGLEYLQRMSNNLMDVIGAIYRENSGDICRDKLAKIVCPTLILHGKMDAWVGVNHANFLHENIKNSRYAEHENGKHSLHLQFPEWFNQQVTEFLISN